MMYASELESKLLNMTQETTKIDGTLSANQIMNITNLGVAKDLLKELTAQIKANAVEYK